jgi:subtilisin family serine protease
MLRGLRNRHRGGELVAIAIATACLVLPTAAGAAVLAPKHHGRLSAGLAELAKPAVAAESPPRQAAILGLPETGPGSLIRDGRRLLVDIRFDNGAVARLDSLRDEGARIVAASRRYQLVTVSVPPAALRSVAGLPGVASAAAVLAPVVRSPDPCKGGLVISEGVTQLNVEEAREKFLVDGEGVTVGVLSDSFDLAAEAVSGGQVATNAEEDIKSEDLPGEENECLGQAEPVDVVDEFEPGPEEEEGPYDEGRAMLQIVHDVAPQASLAFASAFNGEPAFAHNIEKLAKEAGATVIVDDVGYFNEPFFQDGPVAAAVNKVTAEGVTYLSAAGNDNLFDPEGNEIASWEAPAYRDSGSCPGAIRALSEFNAGHCLDFNPEAPTDRTFGIRVEPEETLTVDLQWAEPWFGVGTDLDAFLLDANGELLTGAAEDNVKAGEPVEIVQWTNESSAEKTVQLVVNRFSGGNPRLKFILLQNGGGVTATEYPRSGGGDVVGPTIYGHAAAAGAIAAGAVRYSEGKSSPKEPEEYSSRGPVTHYFGPVESNAPAPPISPDVISKPDVAATDCGQTTFFARELEPTTKPGVWRFCGTSAAAPHAAGVAALLSEAAPAATVEELRTSLTATGSPVGSFGACAIGGGLVESVAAVEAVEGGPIFATEPCLPPNASGTVFVAPGNWGSEEPPAPPPVAPPLTPPAAPAPSTRFAKHPPKVVRTWSQTARVVFRFASDQPGVSFVCKIDRAAYRPCGAKLVHRFAVGRHAVLVRARNAAGLSDPTPAVFRFRVERIG